MNGISFSHLGIIAVFTGLWLLPAHANDESALPDNKYVISLGAGAKIKSLYPGSSSFKIAPFPVINVERFYLPGVGQVIDGKTKKRGFGLYPSFDFTGKRDSSDSSDLVGTTPIDWAVELGVGARYRHDWIQTSVELRQGFNGHNGQVVEAGIDFITNPFEKVEFVFGPKVTWASKDYMQTYFGVTTAESAAPGSILAPYSAGAGFKTVGLDARASYSMSEKVTLHFRGGWNRFIGEAADSPIVNAGSKNELTVGMGISYRFAFDG